MESSGESMCFSHVENLAQTTWAPSDHEFVRTVLRRYRQSLIDLAGVEPARALAHAPDSIIDHHRHYLIIFRSFAESRVGLSLPDEALLDLSVAAYSVMRMAVAIDKAFDELRGGAVRFALENQQVLLILLLRHVPEQSIGDLWTKYGGVMDRYWRVAHLERASYALDDPDSIRLLDEVQWYKSCPLYMVLDWINCLAPGRVDDDMYRTLDRTSKVWQIIDDIADFVDDMQNGQRTLIGHEVAAWCARNGVDLAGEDPDMQRRLMFLCPQLIAHIEEGSKICVDAMERLKEIGAGHWVQPLQEGMRLLSEYKRCVEKIQGACHDG